jgi:hypothetical protein
MTASDEIVNIDIAKEIERSESIWKLFRGHIGIGKTLYMTGEVFMAIVEYGIKLVITNYDLYGLPEGVEVFKTGSVRKIMIRMLENYDETTKSPKLPVLIVIDEINNTLSSKQAASNISTWITTIASNARKYGVRAFYFSTQGRKQSDYRLRVNCSYEIAPTGQCDVDNHPLAYWWDDAEKAEADFHRKPEDYEDAVLISSPFPLEQSQHSYNTTALVPIDLNPSVKEEELGEVMESILSWFAQKGIAIQEYKRTDVKDFIKRWNNDKSVNVIPYSPSGCEVIFSELVRLGYIEPREEKPEVAEEEPEVKEVSEVKESSITQPTFMEVAEKVIDENKELLTAIGSERPPRGQVQFCCGQLQSNIYKHRGTKKHLKSVNGGQPDTVSNSGRESD